MQTLNGNSIDKDSFNELIKNHIGQLKTDVGLEYLIADSVLYTTKNLQEMMDCLWISLVPGTINLRHEIIDAIVPELMQTPDEKCLRSLCCSYAGINQRWLVLRLQNSQPLVLNMNSHHILLLRLWGEKYEKLYSGNG